MNEKKKAVITSELKALLLSLEKNLNNLGYIVFSYTDPLDAVNAAIQKKPDIVISDFQFSSLMGLEVIQQIKIKYPEMKSILLVNDLNHPDVRRAESLGASILEKPINIEKIEKAIKQTNNKADDNNSNKNVFLIEKNPNIRFTIKQALSSYKNIEITESTHPYDLIEKYFIRNWNLIIFDIDNPFLSADMFLEEANKKMFKPETFILISTDWDTRKTNKFLSNNFQFFIKVPIDINKLKEYINIILSDIIDNIKNDNSL